MSFDKRLPIYEQVVWRLKKEILSGAYPPNHVLPSRRELSQVYQINPNTVQRAFKQLEEEGLIVTDNNVPSRVTEDHEKLARLKENTLENMLREFILECEALGISKQDVIIEIEKLYGKEG